MRVSPLLTDLYELTMMCSYIDNGKTEIAAFELFTRKLPERRNYLVYAGLEDVINYLMNLRFEKEEIDYLHSLKVFPDWFLDFLKDFEFTGNLYSMDEGTIFFQDEPVLRVEAPIYMAQLLETAVMNQVHISSLIATKASRVYSVSRGKILSDFSLRRTHGMDAGLKVARSCYICGFSSTSNVLAGKIYGIPVVGTVAHSYIMSFETEEESFRAYARTFPDKAVLLVDTYDTVKGVEKAIEVAKELERKGFRLKGVRLDSGNVVELSKETRKMLDENGLDYVKIIVSGGLDEFLIDEILSSGAPVDIFGVGTKVGTSADSPYIDFVYKLVEVGGKSVMKTSTGKRMYPGRKQVFRFDDRDVIGCHDEELGGEKLLKPVIVNGRLASRMPSLMEIRENFMRNLERLPERVKSIYESAAYRVEVSERLEKLYSEVLREIEEIEEG